MLDKKLPVSDFTNFVISKRLSCCRLLLVQMLSTCWLLVECSKEQQTTLPANKTRWDSPDVPFLLQCSMVSSFCMDEFLQNLIFSEKFSEKQMKCKITNWFQLKQKNTCRLRESLKFLGNRNVLEFWWEKRFLALTRSYPRITFLCRRFIYRRIRTLKFLPKKPAPTSCKASSGKKWTSKKPGAAPGGNQTHELCIISQMIRQ